MIDITSDRLTRLICGTEPKTRTMCNTMVARHLMQYIGGFRDDYSWDRVAVGTLSDDEKEGLILELETEDPQKEAADAYLRVVAAERRNESRRLRRTAEGRPKR